MLKSILIFVLIFLHLNGVAFGSQLEPSSTKDTNEAVIEEGKHRYTAITRKSKMPKYGTCWKDALSNLHSGCKELTDESQSRMALAFTNCFLEKNGMEFYKCRDDDPISECVKHLGIKGYTSYMEFFTHTHSMCVFLQSQVWHEETSKVIVKLNENSVNVSQQLEHSTNLQRKLMENQERSIQTQEKLWSQGNELSKVLEMSKENVREVLIEFKSSTEEQRVLIMEIFEKVANLQSILLGEFTGFYSVIFYVVAAGIVYLITSTPRTNGARFWLFLVLTGNLVVERILVAWGLSEDARLYFDDISSIIYSRIWVCRKMSSVIASVVLVVVTYRYRDYNLINNQLLMEIREQTLELKNFIRINESNGFHSPIQNGKSLIEKDDKNMSLNDTTNSNEVIPRIASSTPKKATNLISPTSSNPYNLRSRSRSQTPCNPIVNHETAEEFANLINKLAENSKATRRGLH